MSLIEPGYMFSQHSLRTFQRCPRRFLLRYIDHQPWPAPEREDTNVYRAQLEAGRIFHEWIARALLGIAVAGHDFGIHPDLALWWQAFEQFDLEGLPAALREVELPLVAPLGDYRLYARYDLLAWERQQGAVIMDWKTLAQTPPSEALRRAMQTRVYLYVLVATSAVVTGGPPIAPEQARMTYWFAVNEATVELPYGRALYEQDRQYLLGLAQRIAGATRDEMARTDDVTQCAACGYRTLCEREALAGVATAATDQHGWLAEDMDFELDQVPEVAF